MGARRTQGSGAGARAALRLACFAALIVDVISACGASSSTPVEGAVNEDAGGSSSGGSSGGSGSSGSSSGSSGGSSSGSSSGAGDAAAPAPPTSILAVHASANLYDFRLCFGAGGAILPFPAYPDDPSHPMPETNYPGVPVGGAVLLPPLELPGGALTVYVVPAYYMQSQGYVSGSEPTCDRLIPEDVIPQAVEYFTLPAVTLPTFGGAVVLAIEGCGVGTGLATGSIAQCGASFSAGTGNLTALAGTLASPDDAGPWTMQLAQLSPSFAQGGGTTLTYVDPTVDASVALTAPASSVGAPVTVALSEAGVTAAYFAVGASSGGAFTESLASIQYFQSPASDPFTYFGANGAYFVAVVGDATDAAAPVSLPDGAANPAFDGHGVHVIAYPESGN
jgi:hypothetical protein